MSPKQKARYWVEFGRIRKLHPEIDRHALHVQALGKDKSSKAFTNQDVDKIFGMFAAILQPGSLNAQVRQIKMPDTRLRYKIRQQIQLLGVLVDNPVGYAVAVMKDKFSESCLELVRGGESVSSEGFDNSELAQLRNTLARCISRLRRKRGWTEHSLNVRAGIERCGCRDCVLEGIGTIAQASDTTNFAVTVDESELVGVMNEEGDPF